MYVAQVLKMLPAENDALQLGLHIKMCYLTLCGFSHEWVNIKMLFLTAALKTAHVSHFENWGSRDGDGNGWSQDTESKYCYLAMFRLSHWFAS